jgi:hypothetical protein
MLSDSAELVLVSISTNWSPSTQAKPEKRKARPTCEDRNLHDLLPRYISLAATADMQHSSNLQATKARPVRRSIENALNDWRG